MQISKKKVSDLSEFDFILQEFCTNIDTTMELPLAANYDDLRRCQDALTDGTIEIEFRRFLGIIQECHMQWQATTCEAQRLQGELDKMQLKFEECIQERANFETKLLHARRLLETESKERRRLEEKLSTVLNFLHNGQEINNKVRETLSNLNASLHKRKLNAHRFGEDQSNGNDINSTCSFLSELSMTQCEDDLLDVTRPFKKHRPSANLANVSYVDANQKRRSARKTMEWQKNTSLQDSDVSERIVAITKVTLPQDDGPIEATSTIQALPNSALFDYFENIGVAKPKSDFNVQLERILKDKFNNDNHDNEHKNSDKSESSAAAQCTLSTIKEMEMPVPSAPPLLDDMTDDLKPMYNFQMRQHEFTNRTVLRSESCVHCLKKFRFGSSAMKCRSCGIYLHQECKMQFKMACIPKNQAKFHGKQGYIADYVPAESPLIPSLIVHCVNEIERRGLTEKGLYRVSGSEKEIKALKERILRGKSVPLLSNADVHVICGCIKDFLRGLKEPLIPTGLWKDFTNAVQMIDDKAAEYELHVAIDQMPQANQDTLAFLVLHLQRVANSEPAQMPIDNLAKIFGPTILGYSCADPDHHAILSETMVQKDVMEHLLNTPTEHWKRVIDNSTLKSKTSIETIFGRAKK